MEPRAVGRLLAIVIVGAVVFYVWTHRPGTTEQTIVVTATADRNGLVNTAVAQTVAARGPQAPQQGGNVAQVSTPAQQQAIAPTSVPVQPAPNAPAQQIEEFDQDLGLCPQSCQPPGQIKQGQVAMVHGDISSSGKCSYHVYTAGQSVPKLGTGTYRVRLIQGSPGYIDQQVKLRAAQAAQEVGGFCPQA
jgi:hypothetical protein